MTRKPIPDQFIITLRKPAMQGDIAYPELRLREPTAGELMALDGQAGWARKVAKIAAVSGLPKEAMDGIGLRDLNRANAYLARFSETEEALAEGAAATGDQPEEMLEELIIPLRRAVEWGDAVFHELRLHEPTAGEMIKLDKLAEWTANVKALALISGIPEGAVMKIGERDARRGAEYLGGFFGEDLSTGVSG